MDDAWGFATRPIVAEDPASSFSCGRPELDDFFARHALANDRRGFGKVFVIGSPDGLPPRVQGFYTLCAAVVVDAKDAGAERFYARYSFETLDPGAEFPRRMLVPMATILAART